MRMNFLYRALMPGAIASALLLAASTSAALAQSKQTITFAAAMFSEAGRGDRAKAWVDKFNKSQNEIEVQPIAIPFSSFANTVFTQSTALSRQ